MEVTSDWYVCFSGEQFLHCLGGEEGGGEGGLEQPPREFTSTSVCAEYYRTFEIGSFSF